MEVSEVLELKDIKYSVSFKWAEYRHLCSFREMYDLTVTKYIWNVTFGTYTPVEPEKFKAIDYKVFTHLLYKAVNSCNLPGDLMGLLVTLGTGNRSRWAYVLSQQSLLMPLFEKYLPVVNKTVLYSRSLEDDNIAEGTEDEEGYEELTLFNLSYARFTEGYEDEEVAEFIDNNQKEKCKPTKEAIQQYLRSL